MKICNNASGCNIDNCPHKYPHDDRDDPDDSCSAPCDVTGGVDGSTCVDTSDLPDLYNTQFRVLYRNTAHTAIFPGTISKTPT